MEQGCQSTEMKIIDLGILLVIPWQVFVAKRAAFSSDSWDTRYWSSLKWKPLIMIGVPISSGSLFLCWSHEVLLFVFHPLDPKNTRHKTLHLWIRFFLWRITGGLSDRFENAAFAWKTDHSGALKKKGLLSFDPLKNRLLVSLLSAWLSISGANCTRRRALFFLFG